MSKATADELDDLIHGNGMAYGRMGTYTERISRFLDKHIVIPRSETCDGGITEEATPNGITVKAGSGPESVYEFVHVNPNWLRNKAVNLLNVADYIENRERILADVGVAKAAALTKRRDELATEIFGARNYADLRAGAPAAIDRIIELEDAAK